MNAKDLILAQFPGKVAIPLVDAGRAIGMAEQTCYNLHHRKRFPLRTHMRGRKPMVALTELINYLEERSGQGQTQEPSSKPKRKPGRPRNSERDAENVTRPVYPPVH